MQPSSQGSSYQPTTNSIAIYVTSPLLDATKGFFTYLVSGSDQHGPIEIRRRFNDFYYLRQSLKKKWPGLYICPVPEKMLTGNKVEGNIEMRRRYFECFLQGIAQSQHLFGCSITQEFLRNKNIDMEKFFTTFSYPKPEQTIKEYKSLFPQLNGLQQGSNTQAATAQQKKSLTDFSSYLKKADKQLKHMRSTLQDIIDSRNSFLVNLHTVTSSTLPSYQKNVYSEYLTGKGQQTKQELLFASRPKVQESVHKLKEVTKENSFEACADMVAYEVLEVEAMQELLTDRDGFQTHYHKSNEKLLSSQSQLAKLTGGKTTFKSFFTKGNKEQQIKSLQSEVPQLRFQVQHWRQFYNTITVLIATREIPRFKRQKQVKYYDVMHVTSQREINYLAVYGELMRAVMQGVVRGRAVGGN